MNFSKIFPSYIKEGSLLYESAFPEIERRPTQAWISLMQTSDFFHAEAIIEKNTFCGIFTYWDFRDFIYVEHFAIEQNKRSGGYGSKAIQQFIKRHPGRNIVLEVEQPENEISIRRIDFYKKNGLSLIEKEYLQPPYQTGFEFLPLFLMSTQPVETIENFEKIKMTIYKSVYGVIC